MELVTSIVGGKAPRDGAAMRIALSLQNSDALSQDLHTCYATRQTATSKDTDLDLGHIQPTAMFGRVMELHSSQDPSCLGWLKGFVESSRGMRVQVILHDAHIVGLRVDTIDQPADAVGVVDLGATLGHLHMAPAGQRLNEEKQIGRAPPL